MSRSLNAVVRGCTVLVALGATFVGLPAHASPVVFNFTGTVTNDSGYGPISVNGVNPGDPITGSFHYDSGLTGTTSPNGGTSYLGDVGLTVTFGSQTFDFSSPLVGGVGVWHQPGQPFSSDSFQVAAVKDLNPITGSANFASFSLVDPSGTAFTDESLPTSLDLSKFSSGTIGVFTTDGSVYSGDINLPAQQQVVPEPATVAIFLVGIGACAVRRKGVRLGTNG